MGRVSDALKLFLSESYTYNRKQWDKFYTADMKTMNDKYKGSEIELDNDKDEIPAPDYKKIMTGFKSLEKNVFVKSFKIGDVTFKCNNLCSFDTDGGWMEVPLELAYETYADYRETIKMLEYVGFDRLFTTKTVNCEIRPGEGPSFISLFIDDKGVNKKLNLKEVFNKEVIKRASVSGVIAYYGDEDGLIIGVHDKCPAADFFDVENFKTFIDKVVKENGL